MIQRLNPFLPEVIADPYPIYRRYRAEDPVHWGVSSHPQLPGAWYLFRYQEVMQVLEDSTRFGRIADRACQNSAPPVPKAYNGFRSMVSHWMVFQDPPNHTRLRSLVNKAFSTRMVESLRPTILDIANNLLDHGLRDHGQARGEMDLIEEFALPLPVMVIAALLGVNPADRLLFRQWSIPLLEASTSRLTPTPETYARAEQATQALIEYFKQAIAERHAEPRLDLITALVKAQDQSDQLSDEEVLAMCIHLLTAGHETTVNLIGKGMLALLRNPNVLQQLYSCPEAIPGAVEELLRYDSPVQLVTRWAYADVEVGGKLIRRGDSVGLMLGSANRDPARFQNPDVLDIQREPCRHSAFGSGIHFCLGAALARTEAQIAFRILLDRLPDLRLVGETIQWADSLVFHGLKHLHIAFNSL